MTPRTLAVFATGALVGSLVQAVYDARGETALVADTERRARAQVAGEFRSEVEKLPTTPVTSLMGGWDSVSLANVLDIAVVTKAESPPAPTSGVRS